MSLSTTGVVLAIALLAIAACTIAFLPPLHPAQLWSVPWALAVVMYALRLLPYRSLSWSTTIIAAAAAVAFVLSSLAGERWARASAAGRGPSYKFGYVAARGAAVVVLGMTLIGVAAFVASAASTYGVHDTLTASPRLRRAIDGGALSFQIKYVWAALAGVTLSSIAAALAPQRRSQSLWMMAAVGCGACIYFATGRATIVAALVIGLVAYLSARSRPVGRSRFFVGIGAVGAISLAIFVAGGHLIGKTYANDSDLQSVPSFFTRHPSFSSVALAYQYVSAPLAALDVQVHASTTWGDAHGCATAAELCRALGKLGLHVAPVKRIRPFTAPPLIWNTYTGLDVPLIDWGTLLTIPVVGLIGAVCGVLWSWSRRRLAMGLIAYSIEAAAIAGSWTTFTFTAPHLIGAFAISLLVIWLVDGTPARLIVGVLRGNRRQARGLLNVPSDRDESDQPVERAPRLSH